MPSPHRGALLERRLAGLAGFASLPYGVSARITGNGPFGLRGPEHIGREPNAVRHRHADVAFDGDLGRQRKHLDLVVSGAGLSGCGMTVTPLDSARATTSAGCLNARSGLDLSSKSEPV